MKQHPGSDSTKPVVTEPPQPPERNYRDGLRGGGPSPAAEPRSSRIQGETASIQAR